MSVPPTTSDGQCAPVCTREYATAAATGAMTAPATGRSIATPAANAAALAEWPEGNDGDVGSRRMRRAAGSSVWSGRCPPNSRLPMRFATALAVSRLPTPRIPARQRPAAASENAMPNHSSPRSAARDRARRPVSTRGWYCPRFRRLTIARSARPTHAGSTRRRRPGSATRLGEPARAVARSKARSAERERSAGARNRGMTPPWREPCRHGRGLRRGWRRRYTKRTVCCRRVRTSNRSVPPTPTPGRPVRMRFTRRDRCTSSPCAPRIELSSVREAGA